jgi:hypothetical protein
MANGDGLIAFDAAAFSRAHTCDLDLFTLAEPVTR